MTTPKIFLFYSHPVHAWAQKFTEALTKLGMSVWVDQASIKFEEPSSDAIEKGLRESDAVVLLINPESINQPNLFFGLGAALGMNKPIIGVVTKDSDFPNLPLQRIKYLVRTSPEKTAKELALALKVMYGEAA